jgi:hypothetical protein
MNLKRKVNAMAKEEEKQADEVDNFEILEAVAEFFKIMYDEEIFSDVLDKRKAQEEK